MFIFYTVPTNHLLTNNLWERQVLLKCWAGIDAATCTNPVETQALLENQVRGLALRALDPFALHFAVKSSRHLEATALTGVREPVAPTPSVFGVSELDTILEQVPLHHCGHQWPRMLCSVLGVSPARCISVL